MSNRQPRQSMSDDAQAGLRVIRPGDARNERDDRHFRVVLAAVLAPDSTVVDVGANIGEILAEIVRIAPAGRHVVFEPLPHLAAQLREAYPDLDVREVALSDATGSASFVHVVDIPGYSGLRERTYPGDVQRETITVRTARLDDELPGANPALLKIDVEGAELQVLRGATQLLQRARPVVWFEHGYGAADHYGTRPEHVWDLLSDVDMRVYDADAHGPLSRDEFVDVFESRALWNYLARPI